MQTLGSIFGLVMIVIVMLLTSVPLALTALAIMPVIVLTTQFFSQRSRLRFRQAREAIGEVSSNLQENISGIREAQAFDRTGRNMERFAQANAANRDANVGAVAFSSALTPTLDVLSALATAIVAALGGWLAAHGTVDVGTVVAFLLWVGKFFRPIQQLSAMFTLAQASLAASERVFELLDEPVTIADVPGANGSAADPGPAIVFDDVSFAYDPRSAGA